ncbi:MAG: hypothetical protein C0412_18945 [Flavobacterium sp.]|nr:hypothetical protein [Flavobacterium sp.]
MLNNMQEQNSNSTEGIALKERNLFQVFFMVKMGVKPYDYQSEREWTEKYAKLVSDIIDDKSREDNKIIRFLIEEGNYEEASKYVLKALKELEKKEMVYH